VPKVGDLVKGKVVSIIKDRNRPDKEKGAIVKISDKDSGFLHISELSDGYVKNVSDLLKIGQDVEVRVIAIDRKRGKTSLSIKRVNEELHRKIQFEAKMKRFLTESGDKLKQLQKNTEAKQGIKRKAPKKK